MANPQRENGHVDIANEIMEALARTRIPGEARQVLDFIIRKTWGYQKKTDRISMSQISEGTGLSRPHVCRSLSQLVSMRVLSKTVTGVTKYGDTDVNEWRFNKDYDMWQVLPKKETGVAKKGNTVLPITGTRVLPKKVHTKDNSTKDNLQKTKEEKITPLPPSGDDESIPYKKIQDLWNEVCSSHYPAVQSLSDSRRRQIAARWKEHPDLEFWRKVFVRLTIAKHCLGHNDRNWKADFDFIFQNNDKYVKLLEGKYDRGNGNGVGNATGKTPPDPPKPKYLMPYPDPRIKDVPSETTTAKQ